MAVSIKHVLSQGSVLRTLSGVALSALRKNGSNGSNTAVPGPWVEQIVAPLPEDLLRDYLRNVGADPSWYRGAVPPHLFPQWGFPLAAKGLATLPYPLAKALNAGCRMEVRGKLPANQPLLVKARLESVDDDGKRALITTKIVTGTKEDPEIVVSELRAFVPLAKPEKKNGASHRVPADAREVGFLRIAGDAGLDFAKLTGDFNPIHWVPAYARGAGFRGVILHGFGTFARAVSALDRVLFAGDPTQLATIDVRFTKPLLLPAEVGVYVAARERGRLWVGDAPGGGVYLEGTFTARNDRQEISS